MQYNVLTEKWITVETQDGEQIKTGLLDVLKHAHQYHCIVNPSPINEYSIYRLLISFIMDIYRPEDEDDINDLLDDECFDEQKIDDYIKMCEAEGTSFDLLDDKRPFLQCVVNKKLDENEKNSVALLLPYVPSGNNHTHFQHTEQKQCAISIADIIAELVTGYVFSQASGRGYSGGLTGAPPEYDLIMGTNLFQTLVFNCVALCYFPDYIQDYEKSVFWRMTGVIEKTEMKDITVMQGMIFPSRRIRLIKETIQDDKVKEILYQPGLSSEKGFLWIDPHVPYYHQNKTDVILSRKPSREIEASNWQNVGHYLHENKVDIPPLNIKQYKELYRELTEVHLVMYGVSTDKATRFQTMKKELKLPMDIVASEEKSEWIRKSIEKATIIAGVLGKSLRQALYGKGEDKSTLISQARSDYFLECDHLFFEKLLPSFLQCSPDDYKQAEQILEDWNYKVKQLAIRQFDKASDVLKSNAKKLAQIEQARKFLVNIKTKVIGEE